jgi:hypothetical protein
MICSWENDGKSSISVEIKGKIMEISGKNHPFKHSWYISGKMSLSFSRNTIDTRKMLDCPGHWRLFWQQVSCQSSKQVPAVRLRFSMFFLE